MTLGLLDYACAHNITMTCHQYKWMSLNKIRLVIPDMFCRISVFGQQPALKSCIETKCSLKDENGTWENWWQYGTGSSCVAVMSTQTAQYSAVTVFRVERCNRTAHSSMLTYGLSEHHIRVFWLIRPLCILKRGQTHKSRVLCVRVFALCTVMAFSPSKRDPNSCFSSGNMA